MLDSGEPSIRRPCPTIGPVRLPERAVTQFRTDAGRPLFWLRLVGGPLLAITVIVLVFLPLSPAYDLNVFLRAGSALLHGRALYPNPGSAAVYSGSSFVYPYLAAFPFVPFAALTPHLSTILFFVLSVSAVLAACYVGAPGDPWPATLVLCASFTISGLQLGALSPLLFAGTLFLWQFRDRPLWLGLLAGVVVVSKLFLAPILIWLLLARRYRALAYAIASTAALLTVGFVLGPLGPGPYLHLLSRLGAHEARAGFGLIGSLMSAGVGSGAAQLVAIVVALATLTGAYLHWRAHGDERVLFCAGIIASLVATPVLWSHYMVLLAVPLLLLGSPRRWFVMAAAASWMIAPAHGIRVNSDLLKDLPSGGAWVAVVLSLLLVGYQTARRMRVAGDRH
jgi:alpha-1,2-mannosyltransferase